MKRNLSVAELYEESIKKNLALLSVDGALVVDTRPYTGRSPKDKFIVYEENLENEVWWGEVNQKFSKESFNKLLNEVKNYLLSNEYYIEDLYVGADEKYRLRIRLITESPWHALFAKNMFIRTKNINYEEFKPDLVIYHVPFFKANPKIHNTNSEVFIILNLNERIILIGGTLYAGEIKKSVFTFLNYYYPKQGVLSMHCGANLGKNNDSALFFGLSGTGKTSLSTDEKRPLIGDDEHGWSDDGIFNFEGGCYAKVIRISKDKEPSIYKASLRFGTILENVVLREDRSINFDSDEKTENTRSSYPIEFLENIKLDGKGPHPKNIFFLSADAFGILPPIAKLTKEQALFYFLSGYTAKLAGTERGIKEPTATFSACFGAPFLVLKPIEYAKKLLEKIEKYRPNIWLLNTGWFGGPYGIGKRIDINYTRKMIDWAISSAEAEYYEFPIFNLLVPKKIHEIPEWIFYPQDSWGDKDKYFENARKLAGMFIENIKKFEVSKEIILAGPKI
ncbi:MAG: phosphoenolpyruvate carboxykinase (ATP) [candidate division WOR-3 bacterium]|nr:phosphoenolpyruvate carboxykinase (ATP) [candidate division WOR-3 bacterium]